MSKHNRTPSLKIRLLKPKEQATAAVICAVAMRDNPIHIRVFGVDQQQRLRRLKRFFPGMLAYVARKGRLYGAFKGQQLVGVFGALAPSQCRPSLFDVIRLLPSILSSNSVIGWLRLALWLGTWARLDPKTPHWHLGPLAVDPAWQRQGIGTQLLENFFRTTTGYPFYLETDKSINVQLYEKLGFSITACPVILNIKSWVMLKKV